MLWMLLSALMVAAVVAATYHAFARGNSGLVLSVAAILAALGALVLGLAAYGAVDTSAPDSYVHPWGILGALIGAVLAVVLAHYFGRHTTSQR